MRTAVAINKAFPRGDIPIETKNRKFTFFSKLPAEQTSRNWLTWNAIRISICEKLIHEVARLFRRNANKCPRVRVRSNLINLHQSVQIKFNSRKWTCVCLRKYRKFNISHAAAVISGYSCKTTEVGINNSNPGLTTCTTASANERIAMNKKIRSFMGWLWKYHTCKKNCNRKFKYDNYMLLKDHWLYVCIKSLSTIKTVLLDSFEGFKDPFDIELYTGQLAIKFYIRVFSYSTWQVPMTKPGGHSMFMYIPELQHAKGRWSRIISWKVHVHFHSLLKRMTK